MTNNKKASIVALIQMNSTSDKAGNVSKAAGLIKEAASKNAELVVLPEVFTFRGRRDQVLENAEHLDGLSLTHMANIARDHGIYLLAGSICELSPDAKKVFNTSVLINPKGETVAVYRKLHLFDAVVNNVPICESDMYEAGNTPVLAPFKNTQIGLSICYDLRFPELFQYYAQQGASIMTVPSSFTTNTGQAHWEVLLRARAIESQSFVLAPNQTGLGASDVPTYGNSMIIDPWGTVLARADGKSDCVLMATLDMAHLDEIRESLPSLKHRKKIT